MELGEHDVHVWAVRLTGSDEDVTAFKKTLSESEADRCQRFYKSNDQRSYAFSHGALRALLSRYLGIAPGEVQFRSGRAGKPALALPATALEFNMSHSGELALYAFAKGCRVGVDVEKVKPMRDLESLATRFFSPAESANLLSLGAGDQMEAFFRCWTRKEAYIKAVGEGLSIPLDSFEVSLLAGEPPALLRCASSFGTQWRLHHLEPHTGYVGAVAYDGEERTIREWPPVIAADLTGY